MQIKSNTDELAQHSYDYKFLQATSHSQEETATMNNQQRATLKETN
jgi:hypothetical protein